MMWCQRSVLCLPLRVLKKKCLEYGDAHRTCKVNSVLVFILAQIFLLQGLKMAAVEARLRFLNWVACPVCEAAWRLLWRCATFSWQDGASPVSLASCSLLVCNYTYTACAEIVLVLTSWLNVGALIFPMMLCFVKHAQAWTTFAHYIRTSVIRIATWWKKHTSTL